MDRIRYVVGIVTLLLAVAGGVYLVNLLGDEDQSLYFRLNVEYRNTQGLLPGADVKYRGVRVGSVRRVQLRDDGKKGVAVIALNPGQEYLARTNSRFWIVTPRFGGLTSGATGLDTLVRDAYVAFLNPDEEGEQLANGSAVAGWEIPFVDPSGTTLPPPRRGDLLMNLLVPENHGLVVGSKVKFRGVVTGQVREVALAADGGHVRLQLVIDRRHRRTVTDETVFWVARPRLSGGLVGGMSVEDVSALLSPFVSYYTESSEGLPVSDGYVVAAEVQRPEIKLAKISTEGLANPSPATGSQGEKAVQLAHVIYRAEEEDWLSANDHLSRDGTGVLIEAPDGQRMVLTARSICDGSYFERDTFGGMPDIIKEGISVVLADGTTLRARRTWVAEDERDLTLLTLEVDITEAPPATPEELLWFEPGEPGESKTQLQCRVLDSERRVAETELTDGAPPASLDGLRGAAVLSSGHVIGILGQVSGTDATPRIEPISQVPETLRPRQ